MYGAIFDFFYTKVFTNTGEHGYFFLEDMYFQVGNESTHFQLTFQEWLCHTASIISITIIVVLCCLFVYKIIKLIGGLIR